MMAEEFKVCTLLESYYPVVGGMETQARNLCTALEKRGVSQIIVTRRTGPELEKSELVDGIRVYRAGPSGRSSRYRWLFMLTSIPLLIRKRREYDIIFVPGFRVLGISAVIAAKLLGKKTVFKAECIGELSGEFFTGGLESMKMKRSQGLVKAGIWLRNRILLRADVFVTMYSDMTKELEDYGVDMRKVTLIPQSVNAERYQVANTEVRKSMRRKLGLPEKNRIAVYTGRIVSYKGVPVLLREWERLRREMDDITLVICGSGGVDIYACEDEMRAYVDEHSLADSVKFAGAVRNVDEYLQAADVFVLPTENDAFPLCLLEAMACGLPLITTTVGALKDVIEHRRNGLVMEPGNGEQLFNELKELFQDADLREKLGRAAREDVMNNYTLDIIARRYIELFGETVSAAASGGSLSKPVNT